MDAAKQHSLDDMITDIHADLRLYAVSSHESSLLVIQKREKRKNDKFPYNAYPMELF